MDIEGLDLEAITEEDREAFATHMEKFDSLEAAAVDGMDLKRQAGKAYRIPDTLDGLDDGGKADFTTKARRALNLESAADLDGLKDVNLKKGLPEGSPYDEDFAASFKQFAIDNKIPKSALEPLAEFFNLASAKAAGDMQAKRAADFAAAKQASDDALIAHKDFGSKEKLAEQNVLLHRALTNNVGFDVEEANEVAEFLRDREGATNPTIRRLLLNQLAPLAAESSNDGGKGTAPGERVESEQDKQVKKDIWGG